MKRIFAILMFGFFTAMAQAQQPPGPRPDNPEYLAESQLLTLRFVPKDGLGKIYMAGRKAGDIDFHKNAKILSVTLLKNSRRDTLQFTQPEKNSEPVNVSGLPMGTEPYDLEVKTQVRGKIENTPIHIKPNP